jgi:hypothetical protein
MSYYTSFDFDKKFPDKEFHFCFLNDRVCHCWLADGIYYYYKDCGYRPLPADRGNTDLSVANENPDQE